MPMFVQVAVPVPLRRLFDYTLPEGLSVQVGCRVSAPFGRSTKVGVVVGLSGHSDCPEGQLKDLDEVLDAEPMLRGEDLALLRWAADYYHHPMGEVIAAAMPLRLRRPVAPLEPRRTVCRLTVKGREQLEATRHRAPRQHAVLAWLAAQAGGEALLHDLRDAVSVTAGVRRTLAARGWIEETAAPIAQTAPAIAQEPGPALNASQSVAVAEIEKTLGQFSTLLLEGVTGSGKTEVYLRAAKAALARGQGVLFLVPEISLTPQLLQRIRTRLGESVSALHSGLADSERERAWHAARQGLARVLLGTRSAVFTPMPSLGLIVVDEEHDTSFKQQEGFRYSARDLAVVRARLAGCPVVLGSATPSLETLRNAGEGRYRRLNLPQRAGGARPPRIEPMDLRDQPLQAGLAAPLIERLERTLAAGEQAMLFLNRRGYAPVLTCFACGWMSECPRCDARQTLHRASGLLWCHHCGYQKPVPLNCPACGADHLHALGQGTERLDGFLQDRFPGVDVIRVDRDSIRRGGLQERLERLREGRPAVMVGTQMLAKGHDFPLVTLVGVVDIDGGLFSADFRATERMAQLLVQVAGRSGRAHRPGVVVVQTHFPDHPLVQTLIRDGYAAFAGQALRERAAAAMPPFSHQALIRAEALRGEDAEGLLKPLAARAAAVDPAVEVWGPVPAPMARRAGRHRMHLLLQSLRRDALHGLLRQLPGWIETQTLSRRVRWSLDVDPVDLY